MIIRLIPLLVFVLSYAFSFAQGTIHGKVIDNKTNEVLPGVSIKVADSIGTLSDTAGRFSLSLPAGHYKVTISFVGYQKEVRDIQLEDGQNLKMAVALENSASVLNTVVITGSKSEMKLSEEPVSIEVVKPGLIKNINSITLADAVDKVTGVQIMDNQADIRGGSGYSFGAGSRVLLLLDDMPLLTIDRGEIKWDFIPLEIADQVEVDKSAGSALYGASALNGIINVRTGYAGDQPQTEISTYYTGYARPSVKGAAWWDSTRTQPYRAGAYITHKRRIGQWDIVGSFNGNNSIGYIRQFNTHYLRLTLNIRYRSKKIPGLSLGVNTNIMQSEDGDYFFWLNSTYGLYIPYGSSGPSDPGSLSMSRRWTYMVDPWLHYFDKHGNKHIFRNRYNHVNNQFPGSSFTADYIFSEYQFQRLFKFGLSITAGATSEFYFLYNPATFGIHHGDILSGYVQLEQTLGPVHIFAGVRAEHLQLDTTYNDTRVVGSAGINIKAGKASFLRASFGQGYRVPSLAELFVDASQAGIQVLPNPTLKPEYGINAELGFKQGFKIGHFQAYFDAALFWMDYWDMEVFQFGDYLIGTPPAYQLGFQAQNISRARIAGYETSIVGEGKIGRIPLRWQTGFTYDYPADLSVDTNLRNVGNFLNLFIHSLASKSESVTYPELTFRSRYIVKSDVEMDLWKFTIGADFQYYSFVNNVDPVFLAFIPGLNQFRQDHQNGSFLLGLRGSFSFGKYGKISLIIGNALNEPMDIRPAEINAPLSYTFQYRVNF